MRIEVNALDYVTEDVLFIVYRDRYQRLAVYLLKSLNKTEINYKIHNKKILVVIRRLENQRYLLEDTKFKFEV